MRSPGWHRVVLLPLAVGMLTSACGDDTPEAAPDLLPVITTTVPVTIEENPGTVPAALVDYCEAAAASAQAGSLPPEATPDETQEFYEGLVSDVDGRLEFAPSELQADLSLIRSNFDQVSSILAGVDWDLDAGLPLVEQWVEGSAEAAGMDAAIGRIETFDTENCGIG